MGVELILGDALEVVRGMPDESFCACFCDPPYGLGKQPDMEEVLRHWLAGDDYKGMSGFMGKSWDGFVPGPATWKEVYRVLKPGAVLLAFAGTRTADMLSVALRLAGFHKFDEIDHFYGGLPPQLSWITGSGFPKSASIGKMLDKAAGKEREVVGKYELPDVADGVRRKGWECTNTTEPGVFGVSGQSSITAPATDAAKVWEGYGTALKPAHEIILCFRKPRCATYAQTAVEHGTGALNVDGCRVGTHQTTTTIKDFSEAHGNQWGKPGISYPEVGKKVNPPGRWPANLLLSHVNLPVMKLTGNLPCDTVEIIRRYYNGYTRVSAMRARSGDDPIQVECGPEVLQSEMQDRLLKNTVDARPGQNDLPTVRQGIHHIQGVVEEGTPQVLQQSVSGSIREATHRPKGGEIRQEAHFRDKGQDFPHQDGERSNAQTRQTSELEGREVLFGRICACDDRDIADRAKGNGTEDAPKTTLCLGASSSSGNEIGTPSAPKRDSTSSERKQERQQARECGFSGAERTFTKASANRTGVDAIERGEYSLEVFACDVPGWLAPYFEYTGEDLGCERVGVKRVKGSGSQEGGGTGGIWSDISNTPVSRGYADPDGLETVAAYRCSPDCPVAMLDRQAGKCRSATNKRPTRGGLIFGKGEGLVQFEYGAPYRNESSSSASRFFQTFERFYYCPKASRKERDMGLEGMPRIEYQMNRPPDGDLRKSPLANRNPHPTIKPLALCEYLARLIVPPEEYRDEAQLLVPFMGSGSEIIGALMAGWRNVTGIDISAEYLEIAKLRIAAHTKEPQQMTLGGD